jgi:curved DNA-binding protein CbpA
MTTYLTHRDTGSIYGNRTHWQPQVPQRCHHFKRLGVPTSAAAAAVAQAYRKQAKLWHPDKWGHHRCDTLAAVALGAEVKGHHENRTGAQKERSNTHAQQLASALHQNANRSFCAVSEAYDVLSCPNRGPLYRLELAELLQAQRCRRKKQAADGSESPGSGRKRGVGMEFESRAPESEVSPRTPTWALDAAVGLASDTDGSEDEHSFETTGHKVPRNDHTGWSGTGATHAGERSGALTLNQALRMFTFLMDDSSGKHG